MPLSENTAELSNEEKEANIKAWNQEQFVKIQKYALSKGIQVKGVKQELSRCLPPVIGVWYINSTTQGEDYWIVSGSCPTDIAASTSAKNARQALSHFSLTWQLQAANLEAALADNTVTLSDKETQQKWAEELVNKAEMLYSIYNDQELWAGSGLE
jgi:hypothetical protein